MDCEMNVYESGIDLTDLDEFTKSGPTSYNTV